MLAFSTLWSFGLREPKQLLILLCSFFLYFCFPAPLTEQCTHLVFVCASTTYAIEIEYYPKSHNPKCGYCIKVVIHRTRKITIKGIRRFDVSNITDFQE